MCGRFTLTTDAEDIREEFGVDVPADYQPRYNIAPQQPILAVGLDAEGNRRASWLRWGLVPFWAESPGDVTRTINARAESLLRKPAFRESFLHRRCLIVADGFYEWRKEDSKRQPYRFILGSGRLMAFAGVWDRWKKGEGETLFSCAIVTTPASSVVAPIHDRMPAILDGERRDAWLKPDADPAELAALLRPFERKLESYKVSTAVNAAANDSPDIIEPVE